MPTHLRLADRTVDLDTGRIGDGAELRPMELKVLRYLAARPDQVVSHRELLVVVWGYARRSRSTTVYSTVYRLRQALEVDPSAPRHLQTVPGAGVRLTGVQDEALRADLLPPLQLDAFVGREALLARLATDPRLATLHGLGGAGKTRLAHEHARRSRARFPGGCWWCDASTAGTAAAVAERICAALDLDGGPGALGPALAARGRLLLVLDDVRVGEPLAVDLARWLAEAHELRVVATASAPLGLPGEQRLLVGPLDASLALFLDRARAVDPTFAPDPPLDALLDALDHLPLAIELAAARAALVGTAATLAAVTRRATVHPSVARRAGPDPGDRSLDDVVAWTCRDLAHDQRRGLACLAAFAVSFDVAAAERVLCDAGERDAPALIAALRERGLVHPAEPERFRLVSLVARSLAVPPGATSGHTAHYAALAHALFEACDRSPPAVDPHDGVDVDELLAAAWRQLAADPDGAVPLVLWAQVAAVGARRVSEMVALTDACSTAPLSAEGRVLVRIAAERLLRAQGRRGPANELRDELVRAASEAGRHDLAAGLALDAARDHRNRGSLTDARAALESALRSRDRTRSTGRSEARFRGAAANVRASLLDPLDPDVARWYREAVTWLDDDDPVTAAAVRANLGGVLTEQDRLDEAAHALREGLRGTPSQCRAQRAAALGKLSMLAWARGALDDAEEALTAALDLGHQAGDASVLPYLWNLRARLHLGRGAHEPGLAAAHRALGLVRDSEQRHSEAVARLLCGRAGRLLGRPEAETWLWSSLRLGEALGAPWLQGPPGVELVWLKVGQSRADEALRLVRRMLEAPWVPQRAAGLRLICAELERRAGEPELALQALESVAATGSPAQAAQATVAHRALSAELGRASSPDPPSLPADAAPWMRVLAARLAAASGDRDRRDAHLRGLHVPPDDVLLWLGHRELAG